MCFIWNKYLLNSLHVRWILLPFLIYTGFPSHQVGEGAICCTAYIYNQYLYRFLTVFMQCSARNTCFVLFLFSFSFCFCFSVNLFYKSRPPAEIICILSCQILLYHADFTLYALIPAFIFTEKSSWVFYCTWRIF